MSLNIKALLEEIRPAKVEENETAYLLTHVPSFAPNAYLNVVFKPTDQETLNMVTRELRVPEDWCRFLRVQNGAKLFCGALSMFGAISQTALLDRLNFARQSPFSLLAENESWPAPYPDLQLVIGGYGFDGSLVCLDRDSGQVSLFHRGSKFPSFRWDHAEGWLVSEIQRISMLFSEDGKRLVNENLTVPFRTASA